MQSGDICDVRRGARAPAPAWYATVYGALPVPIVIWDAERHIAYANAAIKTLLGEDVALLLWRGNAMPFLRTEHEADAAPESGQTLHDGMLQLLRSDGKRRWLDIRTVPVPGPADQSWELSTIIDQTEEQEASAALKVERGLLQALLNTMPDHIYFKDRNSRIIRANRAQAAYFGLADPEEELGKSDFDFYEHDYAEVLYAGEQAIMATGEPLIGDIEDHSARVHRPYFLQSTKVPIVQDGGVIGIVGISRDITELKLIQDRLSHQALHDSLTGLPNRALLLDRLDQVLRVAHREHTTFALCLLDLDRFKEVNDTLGHQCGDRLLQEVAIRVRSVLRDSDTVARLGGDEFAVLLPGACLEGATATVVRIKHALEKPFDLDGHRPDIAGSIGITIFPEHADDATTLLVHADVAMYNAKQTGCGYAVYDPNLDEHSLDHLALPREFRQALAGNELMLHYQPLMDIAEHRVTTVEALLRWQHPRHGLIPPTRILPLADRIGVLDTLTAWVLDTALAQCHSWRERGLMLRVAVNISPRTLRDADLANKVAQALKRHTVPADFLTLEITEEAFMADPEQVLAVLGQLDKMGVQLAVDDFGTGFSSLAYLKQLPIHTIKIDKSFVIGMAPHDQDEAIVRSVIELSHNLGLVVVAEGIEDQQTLDRLAELRCDVGQGFLMSKPVDAKALENWMRTSQWTALDTLVP